MLDAQSFIWLFYYGGTMVSTRGVKFKFSEGEKVLCYEPDPTKARVLYDSKVLEVKVNKDQRGRKAVEYLIHFQGWNSSWDRCVSEDYVLKDTDENRQLQKDLAEKAELQLFGTSNRGTFLYRRERKKKTNKLSDKASDSLEQRKVRRRRRASSEEGSSESQVSQRDIEDSDDQDDDIPSSGEESSDDIDEEKVPLELSDNLRRLLEQDYELITRDNKLMTLPAEPNVVAILEGYVKHCALHQLCNISEKPQRRYRYRNQNSKARDMERIRRSLNICKEIADGVRVYFDFTLGELLLYNQEREQYEHLRMQQHIPNVKQETLELYDDHGHIVVKEEEEELQHSPRVILEAETEDLLRFQHGEDLHLDNDDSHRKKTLRSHRNVTVDSHETNHINNHETNGISRLSMKYKQPSNDINSSFSSQKCDTQQNFSSIASTSSRCSTPNYHGAKRDTISSHNSTPPNNLAGVSPKSNTFLTHVLSWQMLPDRAYCEVPAPASLVYGATHLTRLFVKLPELLCGLNISDRRMKVVLKHLDMFLAYLEEHRNWFGEHLYQSSTALAN